MRRRAGFVAALAVVAVVAALAASIGDRPGIVALLIAGPLLAAIGSSPRATALVAGLALALGVVMAIANSFGDGYVIALGALVTDAALAVGIASARAGAESKFAAERRARTRADVAARLGRLFEQPPVPDALLGQLVRIAVPELADVCIVDVLHDGRFTRASVHARSAETAERVRANRATSPMEAAGAHPVAVVARTGKPLLLRSVDTAQLRAWATSDAHFEVMSSLGCRSAVVVPLTARGSTLGILSLLRLEHAPSYGAADLDLAREVAGRAALAIDNARLFTELGTTQRQLEAVLANLAQAVTVQRPDGELMYVNDAAVALLGLESREAALSASVAQLAGDYLVFDEQGARFDMARLPGRLALAGEVPEPVVVRRVHSTTGDARWMLLKATPILDDDGAVALAVNVIEDVTDARRGERQQRFLASASKLVSASLDPGVTLEQVAGAVVPELADWCSVDVLDERGRLRHAALAADPAEREALERARADLGSRGGRLLVDPVLIADVTTDRSRLAAAMRPTGTRSVLTAPLRSADRTIGLISIGTSLSGRHLGTEELGLAQELGTRAGIAVEHARVHAARSHIAATLQRGLLPSRLPDVPGVEIAARFRAAERGTVVGGDFYDVFETGDGWVVTIGDVTGKGPEAATTTALARFTMRTAAEYERSPAAVLSRLNTALASDPERERLCAALCVRIGVGDAGVSVTIACGGHPPPLLVDGGVPSEAGIPGPLLGAFAHAIWQEQQIDLADGGALVLFTDGVTDTRGSGGARFGSERLSDALRGSVGLSADAIAGRLDDALKAFEHGPQSDDVALLVLRAAG